MENRVFWIALVVVVLVVGVVIFKPVVEEQLAPTADSAWVAIEVGDSGIAAVEPVELDEGERFTLHAVVGARTRDGERIYYSNAKRIRIGGDEVPAEQIRSWDRSRSIKIRWFTVEGRLPFVRLEPEDGIGAFEYQEFLRSNWPLAWSVPGVIDAAHDDHLEPNPLQPRQRFGTQRYHVRFETYANEDALVPEQVVRSWGVADLRQHIDEFPTVTMLAHGGASDASRFFGLTQIEPPADPAPALLTQISELAKHRLAFSRLTVLHDLTASTAASFSGLPWRMVSLDGTARWDDGIKAGDLLRVGDRVIVLYQDHGTQGILDPEDWCFDFADGPRIRRLAEVYSGEGEVGHAAIDTAASES